jgi:hypothetical protein
LSVGEDEQFKLNQIFDLVEKEGIKDKRKKS